MKLFHDKIEPILEKNICCQGSVLGYEFYFRSKVQIYLKCVSAIHSKSFHFRFDF